MYAILLVIAVIVLLFALEIYTGSVSRIIFWICELVSDCDLSGFIA